MRGPTSATRASSRPRAERGIPIRTPLVLGILLLSAAAPARAQEEASFTDASLDAMPPAANAYADITGGSLALEDGTLVLTVELSALPEMTPGLAYVFLFTEGKREWYAAAINVPSLDWVQGLWAADDSGPTTMEGGSGTYTTGPGGSVALGFPLSVLDPASTEISAPRILTADIKAGAAPIGALPQFIPYDEARGDLTFRIRDASATQPAAEATGSPAPTPEESASADPAASPGPAPSTPSRDTPDAPILFALLGAAFGLALWRRRA